MLFFELDRFRAVQRAMKDTPEFSVRVRQVIPCKVVEAESGLRDEALVRPWGACDQLMGQEARRDNRATTPTNTNHSSGTPRSPALLISRRL